MRSSSNNKPVRQPNSIQPAKNLIDQLGLGPEVERLLMAGMTYLEISQQLNIDVNIVTNWCVRFKKMSEEERKDVTSRSVFNIADRLEENFERLYQLLDECRSAGNIELELRTLAELRMYMDMASKLIEKLHTIKENEKFKEVVLELLDQEAPGIKVKALRKLAEHRQMMSVLKPL